MDKFLNEFVKVYKGKYNNLVTIGKDIYEMSSNANAPNGVNIYLGAAKDWIVITDRNTANDKEIPLTEVSDSMKMAIVGRIEFGFNFVDND